MFKKCHLLEMDNLLMILKKKLTQRIILTLACGYIPVYDYYIGIYLRSQVSDYSTIGPLV